ncbi:MAG: LysR family transcriptional regulator [Actinomycetota bacterium]
MLPVTFPDLQSLDLLVEVVRLGSLSRAARARGVSQPSVSKRMRVLERQLGVRLLDRGPSGSTPTTEGMLVAEWAEALIHSAEDFATSLAALSEAGRGPLRIAASYTVAEYLLPRWIARYRSEHPDDAVALEVLNSASVVERLMSEGCDLGFVETPIVADGLEAQAVATDELVVVVAPSHPWARRRRVSFEAFADTPLVMREAGSGTRVALEERLRELGVDTPKTAVEMGSTAAVRSVVEQGDAPAVLSTLAVALYEQSGALVRVDVDDLVIERTLHAVWPAAASLVAAAERLLVQLPTLDDAG